MVGEKNMETFYDIQQLLKRYGTFIYTGDRLGDLELMNMEIDELHRLAFISSKEYQLAKLIVKREVRMMTKDKGKF